MLLLAELKTFFQTYSLFLDPSCDSWCVLVIKPNFSLTFKNGIGGNEHKFFEMKTERNVYISCPAWT